MLTLDDLLDLYKRYVPVASRHPHAQRSRRADSWWPAHELGHLLTVPPTHIGAPLFGMDTDVSWHHPQAEQWWAYELAAMSVSRRLLVACGRFDLFAGPNGELAASDYDVVHYGSRAAARRILRRQRALRVPRTRSGLEAKLQRTVAAAVEDRR